jgi:hypothetical protein
MLPARFEDIDSAAILNLIEDRVAERKTLEYKEKLSVATGDEKAEFLSDISSLANASGGDIIFGVSDERAEGGGATGIPSAITPIEMNNSSAECARIEQLIETGIQPRIPIVQVKAVSVPPKGFVIVVRVGKSWIAPHMVTYANRSRFYSRNSSTGKVQLDVQQIGAAFAMQRGLGERLRAWKANRISKAVSGNGPVPLQGSIVLYHFVSAATVTDDEQTLPRIFTPEEWGMAYGLMSLSPQNSRYNADGYLMASKDVTTDGAEKRQSYLQIFRDGSLEYGDSYALDSSGDNRVVGSIFEQKIVMIFERALSLLGKLQTPQPVFVGLSLLGMKGRTMALPDGYGNLCQESEPFDRSLILCPDVLIQNLEEGSPYRSTMLPIVNAVWQAAGLEKTPYFDREWNKPLKASQ